MCVCVRVCVCVCVCMYMCVRECTNVHIQYYYYLGTFVVVGGGGDGGREVGERWGEKMCQHCNKTSLSPRGMGHVILAPQKIQDPELALVYPTFNHKLMSKHTRTCIHVHVHVRV